MQDKVMVTVIATEIENNLKNYGGQQMIQLFEIKKNIKKLKREDAELVERYSKIAKYTKEEVLEEYATSENGISDKNATDLLEKNGANVGVKND